MYMWTRNDNDGGLFNEKEGLWWRDPDFNPPYKEPNGQDCYWSRGNGWAYAALVRVMEEMDSDCSHSADRTEGYKGSGYQSYVSDFKLMSKALKDCQREDGFWNCSLHDAANFGGKETSGTALFVYGMAWGVRKGLLDEATYLPVLLKAWNALVKDAVHPNGYLGMCKVPAKNLKTGSLRAMTANPTLMIMAPDASFLPELRCIS